MEVLEDYPEAKAVMVERGRLTLKHDRDAESLTSEDAVNNTNIHTQKNIIR